MAREGSPTTPGIRAGGLFGPRQLWLRLRTEWAKRRGSGHRLEELTASLAGRELLFRAPSLDGELIGAIRAITPQFSLQPDEISRRIWELSQNGSSWAEYDALAPLLGTLGDRPRVLDIGPGMGRSVVFLSRQLGWPGSCFHLFDGDGAARRYPLNAPRSSDSFCGDLAVLDRVLAHNDIHGHTVHDAHRLEGRLDRLPGPFDLVYSFYGVGYHWALDDFWAEISGLLDDASVAIFTVHHSFRSFAALDATPHRFVPFRRILGKDRPLRLLVVARDEERLRSLDSAAS